MRSYMLVVLLGVFSCNFVSQAQDLYFTRGSVITVKSTDVDANLQEFTAKPKVYGVIDQTKKAPMKVITKVKKPEQSVLAEWKKSVKLHDKKDYRKIQMGPKLIANPIADKQIDSIDVIAKKDLGKAAVSLPNKIYVAAPVVLSISGDRLNTDDKFVVVGKYFGQRLPKIMIEYQKNGKWKYKKCKIDKVASLKYQDAQGRENKSCMKILAADPADAEAVGYSAVTVFYPKLQAADARTGYLIIDNRMGINAFQMLSLTSASFDPGEAIPVKYANQRFGQNISPALAWAKPPAGTKSFVITCVDLFKKANSWVHWMVVDIPAATVALAEDASGNNMPAGSVELLNTFGVNGYGGPQPPTKAVHQYAFTIYALDVATLALNPLHEYSESELLDEMNGKIIEKSTLIGTFKQP